MPYAAYCQQCDQFVWLTPDGQCCQGHPRSSLRKVYECAAVAGSPVPPMPRPPAGYERTTKGNSEYEIRPAHRFVHPYRSQLGAVAAVVVVVVVIRLLFG